MGKGKRKFSTAGMKSDISVFTAQFLSLFTVCRAKKHLLTDHLIIQEMTSKMFNPERVYC